MKRAIVVTTENRGVFFGYLKDESKSPSEIIIEQARMCVYWDSETRGVLGLAGNGPSNNCRITHAIPEAKLYKITGIFDCSDDAVKKWEQSIWK